MLDQPQAQSCLQRPSVLRRSQIDQDIYPLDNPKAYVLMQPKRDIYGNVFMELDARVVAKARK